MGRHKGNSNALLPFFVLSLLGVVVSLYLTYSWYAEGFCSMCAYEHAMSDIRFLLQIMEHDYSMIYGVPVSLLSLVVFIITSVLGVIGLTRKIGLKPLAMTTTVFLLVSLVYGSYLQYVAFFVIGKFYPFYTLLYLDLLAATIISGRMLLSAR
jgi:uncharacterized membrane protein